jgi:predicted helicase
MPRGDVMKHMLPGNNLAFHVCRQISIEDWAHILVSDLITDDCYVSNKTSERGYTIPLYLNSQSGMEEAMNAHSRANFSKPFLDALESQLDVLPKAESIFYYIYAILNSPAYRTRYIEFLKIDFPKIPLTSSYTLFEKMASYGSQLIDLHLIRKQTLDISAVYFQQNGDRVVAPSHPKYKNGKVFINKQGGGFTGVPEEVWSFYVGGYQVCHKWLKDRKGRTLSDGDILHYQRIVVALQETITLMQKIDDAIPSWPIE